MGLSPKVLRTYKTFDHDHNDMANSGCPILSMNFLLFLPFNIFLITETTKKVIKTVNMLVQVG